MADTEYGVDSTASNFTIQPGKAMDPVDHPANNMPTATEHHWGTELGDRMKSNFISPGLRGESSINRMEQNANYDKVGL